MKQEIHFNKKRSLSLNAHEMPKPAKAVYNNKRQDFTNVESCHSSRHFIHHPHGGGGDVNIVLGKKFSNFQLFHVMALLLRQ